MSVAVKKGLVLDVKERKTGIAKESGRPWCMFIVRGEKNSKDTVTLFATNAEEASYYTQAKVGNIQDVKKSARRRPDGQWETQVTVTAHIDGMNETAVRDRDAYRSFAEQVNDAPVPTQDDFMDFTKAADFGDPDGLPFN